jgi:hypothetical protein
MALDYRLDVVGELPGELDHSSERLLGQHVCQFARIAAGESALPAGVPPTPLASGSSIDASRCTCSASSALRQ